MFRPKVVNQPVTKIRTDMLVLGIYQDVRPLRGPAEEVDWIYGGLLSRLIRDSKIAGKLGEATLLATQRKLPASKVLIIGLGEQNSFSETHYLEVLNITFKKLLQLQVSRCAMEMFGLLNGQLNAGKAVSHLFSCAKQYSVLKPELWAIPSV